MAGANRDIMLRSFAGDAQSVLKNEKPQGELIHCQGTPEPIPESYPAVGEPASPRSKSNPALIIVGILLLVGGGAYLMYLLFFKPPVV